MQQAKHIQTPTIVTTTTTNRAAMPIRNRLFPETIVLEPSLQMRYVIDPALSEQLSKPHYPPVGVRWGDLTHTRPPVIPQ